jgi:hypothetical protein
MLYIAHSIDGIESTSAVLSVWLNATASVHWTLPPNDPQYTIPGINVTESERPLSVEDQRTLWSALMNSSELSYEF